MTILIYPSIDIYIYIYKELSYIIEFFYSKMLFFIDYFITQN